jgi:hypothetical protein
MRLKVIAIIAVMLSGCSIMTTETRLTTQELHQFKIDCNEKSQKDFLESQRVSDRDYAINGLLLASWLGFFSSINDGTYEERRAIRNGERSNAQRLTEYNRHKECLAKK